MLGVGTSFRVIRYSGDRVVKRETFRGTQTGEFYGLPASGRSVTPAVLSVYRIAGGKVKEIYWGCDKWRSAGRPTGSWSRQRALWHIAT